MTEIAKAQGVKLDDATLKAIDEALGDLPETDPAKTRSPRRRSF